MSDLSPRLDLPFLLPGQAQKHVTVNEALARLDLMVQAAVADRTRTLPPAAPAESDRHIVASGAAGAWAGHDGHIAYVEAGAWAFVTPRPGFSVQILDEGQGAVFDGSTWVSADSLPQTFPELGVATTADAVNRLAVAAPATLFTHAGAGHQVKINKAETADTASLLFQTGWSGRAEIGLAGSDNLSVKVSADNTTWATALDIAASGAVTAPQGLAIGNGNAAAPALAFQSDTDTGLFRTTTNALGIAAGGIERVRVTTGGLQVTGTLTGTAVTQSVADTTAGRLLKLGDFGLGEPGNAGTLLTAAGAADALRGWRIDRVSNASVATVGGPPGATGGVFQTLGYASMAQAQMYCEVTGAGRTWQRALVGGSWTPWRLIYTADTLLGTVAQAGGVPTGAAIERGSNANGDYMRLADGTQVCTRTMTASAATATAWTFPAAFSAAPVVGGIAVAAVLSAVTLDAAPTATAANVSARDKADARRADVVHLTATGRWF